MYLVLLLPEQKNNYNCYDLKVRIVVMLIYVKKPLIDSFARITWNIKVIYMM